MRRSPGSKFCDALAKLAATERASLESDARFRPLSAQEQERLKELRMHGGELPLITQNQKEEVPNEQD